MKKEKELQNKENNYVAPEMDVLELSSERVLGDSSNVENW